MKVRFLGAALALTVACSMAGGSAQAAQYLLTVNGCSSNCLGSFSSIGTVTVTENAGALNFTVALTHGALFNVNGNSQHHAFTFDLLGGGASLAGLTASNFTTLNSSNVNVATTDFAAAPGGPFSQPPFGGNWSNAIDYVGTAHQGYDESNFSFVLSDSLHNLALSMLTYATTYQGQQIIMAADVYSNRYTGNVGAVYHPYMATPEPSTWAMMFMGLFGVGSLLRRKRAAVSAAAA